MCMVGIFSLFFSYRMQLCTRRPDLTFSKAIIIVKVKSAK